MTEGSPTKRRKQERLDKKGQSSARHGTRDAAVRVQKNKAQGRDMRNSGRRTGAGG